MGNLSDRLTVYFDDPFWVAVFERVDNGMLSVSKVTFGAEPKDYEVYDYVLRHYNNLQFSPAVCTIVKEGKKNPKRIQRDVRRHMLDTGIGTKSQQALKLQQEQNKLERKSRCKEEKEAEIQRLFNLRQQKKKEKHKGH